VSEGEKKWSVSVAVVIYVSHLSLISFLPPITSTYPRSVLTERIDKPSREKKRKTRKKEAQTPSTLRVRAPGLHSRKYAHHDDLDAAPAEVAPATDDRVSPTNATLLKHVGGPGLRHDKGAAQDADGGAEGHEALPALDQASTENGDGANYQQPCHGDLGPKAVAEGAD